MICIHQQTIERVTAPKRAVVGARKVRDLELTEISIKRIELRRRCCHSVIEVPVDVEQFAVAHVQVVIMVDIQQRVPVSHHRVADLRNLAISKHKTQKMSSP